MLRIAVQSKGRLYEETMDLLKAAGIKLVAVKRTLLVPSRNFPVELLFLRYWHCGAERGDGKA